MRKRGDKFCFTFRGKPVTERDVYEAANTCQSPYAKALVVAAIDGKHMTLKGLQDRARFLTKDQLAAWRIDPDVKECLKGQRRPSYKGFVLQI